MLIKGMRRQGEFKIFLRNSRDEKIVLRSSVSCQEIENVPWKWDVGVCLERKGVEFVIAG